VRIDQLPRAWPVQVACSNSLLDRDEPLLERGRYHAVVSNPVWSAIAEAVRRRLAEDRLRDALATHSRIA
jgi:hypothetical protein